MDLTEFLLARVSEDERRWRSAAEVGGPSHEITALCQQMLRECEAKRRIVELHRDGGFYDPPICLTCYDGDDVYKDDAQHPCPTLRALVAVWSDHADYDEAWKP